MRYLITGINSGLGKFLYNNIPNSVGLHRDNFDDVEDETFDVIIHCAFNKELKITDLDRYLDDNIFLTSRLKKINHKKFVYISTVDIYNPDKNVYSCCKQIVESILEPDDLILRCSMLVGDTMKDNHITKIKDSVDKIGLSKDSKFNYILMDDLLNFCLEEDVLNLVGVVDFVSENDVSLSELKEHFNSTTELGDYTYEICDGYINPIYLINNKYRHSSMDNIKKYYKNG